MAYFLSLPSGWAIKLTFQNIGWEIVFALHADKFHRQTCKIVGLCEKEIYAITSFDLTVRADVALSIIYFLIKFCGI